MAETRSERDPPQTPPRVDSAAATTPSPKRESGGPPPPLIAGRYQIERELGRGGMGRVYAALDQRLGRRVAVKMIGAAIPDEHQLERFEREARAASALAHPNVLVVHDVVAEDGRPCIVTELLEGASLREVLAEGPLGVDRSLALAVQIAGALVAAHEKGIVHRDLKPENLFLLAGDRVKVLDFGIAKLLDPSTPQTATGSVIGTVGYMAPEQASGDATDGRADLFALGSTLYELLTGQRAFDGRTALEAGWAVLHSEPPPLPDEVPGWLAGIVGRCLAKDPAQRFQSAQELLDALQARLAPAPVRVRRRLPAVLAACAVAGAGALAFGTTRTHPPPGRQRVAVADVVNETSDKDLDVLSGLLVTSLEQSKKLSVLTQARVLDLAAQAGLKSAARVDEATGREVGRHNGVTALLLPAVRRLANTYFVEMRAVDPARDEHLFTLSDRATTKEGLVDLIDRLSTKTRQKLNEEPGELEQSRVNLAESMTRNLEAYQHYEAGVEAHGRDGLRAVALQEMQKALELDPHFAAAHAHLAATYEGYGRDELAEPHWKAAFEDLDRMPERERALLRLRQAQHAVPRDPDAIVKLAEEMIARFPDDKGLLSDASAVRVLGSRKPELAREAARKVLALDPGYWVGVARLVSIPGVTDEETLQACRRAVAVRRSAANLSLLAIRLSEDGASRQEAAAVARESLEVNAGRSVLNARNACDALVAVGAGAECIPYTEHIAALGLNELERDQARSNLVNTLLILGRSRQALQVADSGPVVGIDRAAIRGTGRWRTQVPEALEAARRIENKVGKRNTLAWRGDLAGAAAVDAAIQPGERTDEWAEQDYQKMLAVHEARYDEALRITRAQLEVATKRRDPAYGQHYYLAETLLAAGRAGEAAEVQAAWPTKLNWEDLDLSGQYPRLLLVRARALEKLGRRIDAVKELDTLLAFWKDADADLPLVVEAKAMRARLATPGGWR